MSASALVPHIFTVQEVRLGAARMQGWNSVDNVPELAKWLTRMANKRWNKGDENTIAAWIRDGWRPALDYWFVQVAPHQDYIRIYGDEQQPPALGIDDIRHAVIAARNAGQNVPDAVHALGVHSS